VLVREYVDDGYSGSFLDRPGLEALRRDVRTPLFDAVYFLDTNCIARNVALPILEEVLPLRLIFPSHPPIISLARNFFC
jgi:Resolvase, N terminal domain